jgi:hypothetical protein
LLYLALSYGMIYLLISKRFLRRWNMKEPQVRAAILTAIGLIISVGTMLVGALPMVLLVVALVAFIDYVRSSEALSVHGSGSHMPSWRRMVPILIGLIGSTRQGLAVGLGYCFRHPVLSTAQGALADCVASLPESGGDARETKIHGDDPAGQAPAGQAPPPPEPVLVGLVGSFKQGLTLGLASFQPMFTAAQVALMDGVASLTEYFRSLGCKSDGGARGASKRGDDRALTAQAPAGGDFTEARYEFDGSNLFFVVNGERIAKRGHPRTPEAGKWLPLRDDVAMPVFELLGSQTTPSV